MKAVGPTGLPNMNPVEMREVISPVFLQSPLRKSFVVFFTFLKR